MTDAHTCQDPPDPLCDACVVAAEAAYYAYRAACEAAAAGIRDALAVEVERVGVSRIVRDTALEEDLAWINHLGDQA